MPAVDIPMHVSYTIGCFFFKYLLFSLISDSIFLSVMLHLNI
jgi:hypothetical protein